jgi:hypothetical protein
MRTKVCQKNNEIICYDTVCPGCKFLLLGRCTYRIMEDACLDKYDSYLCVRPKGHAGSHHACAISSTNWLNGKITKRGIVKGLHPEVKKSNPYKEVIRNIKESELK